MARTPIRVMCVEDNQLVAEAIARKLEGDTDFAWLGWVSTSDALLERAGEARPDVVCMDLDVPGQDTLAMIRALRDRSPESRVLILTGHVRADYINEAIDAGAWGYLSKAEESRVIVESIRRVASGVFVLGKLTRAEFGGTGVPGRETRPATPAPERTPVESTEPAPKVTVGRWNPLDFLRRSKTRPENKGA